MLFKEKLEIAFQELEKSGMRTSSYKPLIFRLVWLYGFKVRPPHYRSIISNFITIAPAFAFVWGTLMWIVVWSAESYTLQQIIISSLRAGGLFGLLMACLYKYGFYKHKLSKWNNLSK